jgi:cbb3-type cytochrome oxidase maturation protein
MNSIYLLIPLSLVLVGAAVWAFFWAVNSGQFEDLDEPGRSVLDDEAQPKETPADGKVDPQRDDRRA